MKDAIVKVAVLGGAPQIGKVEVIKDDTLRIEIVMPGVEQGQTSLVVLSDKLSISCEGSYYTEAFELEFKSESLDFKNLIFSRKLGVLYLSVPIITVIGNEPIYI